GSPDEQAARGRVDVDGEGDPRVVLQRRDLVRAGDGEEEELALAQQIADRDGPRAPVGRGVGDLHDRLPVDEVESHRVGPDLVEACSVHLMPPTCWSTVGGRVSGEVPAPEVTHARGTNRRPPPVERSRLSLLDIA